MHLRLFALWGVYESVGVLLLCTALQRRGDLIPASAALRHAGAESALGWAQGGGMRGLFSRVGS